MSNIKLKEIKPYMAILCHNEEQGKAVEEQLLKQGASWSGFNERHYGRKATICYLNKEGKFSFDSQYGPNTYFSDLIEPELTAEEAIRLQADLCHSNGCFKGCPIGKIKSSQSCNEFRRDNPEKVMKALRKYKADHEKKEPEVEWVFKGVADIVGCNEIDFFDTEEKAKEWCERRTVETGNSHAYAPVCRVKAVN